MTHILFINQHYYPDYAATGQLLAELCEDLAASTHFKITVITGQPEKGTYPDGSHPLKEAHSSHLSIYRIYNHPVGDKSILNRLLHFISFWIGSIYKALTIPKPDLLFVMSTPPLLNGMTAMILKMVKGIPFLYNVQDIYPDIAIEMGTLKNQIMINFFRSVELTINRQATHIVTLSEQMKKRIADRSTELVHKISIIPNWSDGSQIIPQKSSKFKADLKLSDKFVIMYSGNIGLSQGIDQLVSAFQQLSNQSDLHFLIVGNGAKRPFIQKMLTDNLITNVTMEPFQSKENLSDSLNAGDVHLVPLMSGMSKYLLPSKFYGICAAGKPVLALVDEGTELDVMIKTMEIGWVVKPGDMDGFLQAIQKLADHPEQVLQMGQKARKLFETTYDRRIATGQYERLISEVLKN